jgi:Uncharacterized protein conserved in bacteria (DUF2242)
MYLPLRSASFALVLSALLGACAGPRPATTFQREAFELGETYSRAFKTTEAQACEAARRALLSQGYVVSSANADLVNARKSFQHDADTHMEIEFRVVCSPEAKGSGKTLVFVSALQERFALKKNNNSASLGVGAIGSVSLPFGGSDDSLVKVASETITAADFYDRYFRLVTRYLTIAGNEAAGSEVVGDKP